MEFGPQSVPVAPGAMERREGLPACTKGVLKAGRFGSYMTLRDVYRRQVAGILSARYDKARARKKKTGEIPAQIQLKSSASVVLQMFHEWLARSLRLTML